MNRVLEELEISEIEATHYGATVLYKAHCPKCKIKSIFDMEDKTMNCCGNQITLMNNIKVVRHRESESPRERKYIPQKIKRKILWMQKNCCIICGYNFGKQKWFKHDGIFRPVLVNFDHFVPHSFLTYGVFDNLYAMCNICNQIKWSYMFNTIIEARKYIMSVREERGYNDLYTDVQVENVLRSLGNET